MQAYNQEQRQQSNNEIRLLPPCSSAGTGQRLNHAHLQEHTTQAHTTQLTCRNWPAPQSRSLTRTHSTSTHHTAHLQELASAAITLAYKNTQHKHTPHSSPAGTGQRLNHTHLQEHTTQAHTTQLTCRNWPALQSRSLTRTHNTSTHHTAHLQELPSALRRVSLELLRCQQRSGLLLALCRLDEAQVLQQPS
eukprot:1159800-Pelagomonas_calceolata.AAC.4